MAYAIHLEGCDGPFDAERWRQAVAAVEEVRFVSDEALTVTNPKTGEVITVPHNPLDAEFFRSESNEWQSALFWRTSGSVTINATTDFDIPESSLRRMLIRLADHLNATIVGDEGETYYACHR